MINESHIAILYICQLIVFILWFKGMIFGPYTKCAFDGHLYCNECMGQGTKVEEHVIPSRIVHDWDFRVQPVCRFNKRFLVQ